MTGTYQGSAERCQVAGTAAAEGAPSFLVPSSESVVEKTPEIVVEGVGRICPKRPMVVVCDQDSSLRYPASCDAYRCECCGPRKAMQAAALGAWAIRQADRGRFFTGTLAPEDWQARRQKMRDVRRYMARRGYPGLEWAWSTEKGSKTGMVHVHALVHGPFIPAPVWNEVWGARTNIKAIRTEGVARYVTKESLRVAGYSVKGTRAGMESMQEALDLNGGRPLHWSRGFLHGRTKRDAMTELRAELAGGEERTWHLEPVL